MSQLYSFTAAIVSGSRLHLFLASHGETQRKDLVAVDFYIMAFSWKSYRKAVFVCPHSWLLRDPGVRNLSKTRDASMICQCLHCFPPILIHSLYFFAAAALISEAWKSLLNVRKHLKPTKKTTFEMLLLKKLNASRHSSSDTAVNGGRRWWECQRFHIYNRRMTRTVSPHLYMKVQSGTISENTCVGGLACGGAWTQTLPHIL